MKTSKEILASNLKRLRTEAGLTRAELAEMAGLSPAMITKLEYGETSASGETLDKIAQALKIEQSRLYQSVQSIQKNLRDIDSGLARIQNNQASRNETVNQIEAKLLDAIELIRTLKPKI